MASRLEQILAVLRADANELLLARSLAQREAANARRQDRRSEVVNDRRAGMSDRLSSMKAKDDETMAMFRQMAQSKFGPGR